MIRTALVCLAAAIAGGAATASDIQAPRLYGEGLYLGGPYSGAPVEGHAPGYFPLPVPSRAFVYPEGAGHFTILVKPNLVAYRDATVQAADAARRYCGTEGGGPAAVITAQARYSELDVGSWGFSGHCR